MKSICTLLVLGLAGLAYWYFHQPISYPPGLLITDEPTQLTLPADTPAFAHGGFHLRPLAVFSIDARVLHRKVYRNDRQAALVPVDLALGWGPMSNQQVLDRLRITQSMRFYWFRYPGAPPIPKEEIVSHSTNVHIIPATPEIASRCKSLRAGSLIRLSGDLVEATGPGFGAWRSSLSRTDTGNGACELMWVKGLSILSGKSWQDRQAIATR